MIQQSLIQYRPGLKHWKVQEQTHTQKIKAMQPAEVLDKILDLHTECLASPTREKVAQYNWWADVYNFMRGKCIIEQKSMPIRDRQRSPRFDQRERVRHRDNMCLV